MLLKVAHVVVHDGPVLFLFGFLENDGHRFDDIIFHPFGVVNGVLYFINGGTSLTNTSLVLFFEFLNNSPLKLVNNFVELAKVLFNFSLFFLIDLSYFAQV